MQADSKLRVLPAVGAAAVAAPTASAHIRTGSSSSMSTSDASGAVKKKPKKKGLIRRFVDMTEKDMASERFDTYEGAEADGSEHRTLPGGRVAK